MSNSDSEKVEWRPGDRCESPLGVTTAWCSTDPASVDAGSVYRTMVATVVPRPIAFVSTRNRNGKGNLAPFSYFNAVASDPATLMISITPKRDGTMKDTLRNIRETGQFTVNLVSEWMLNAMNQCSAEYPYGVDEMHEVGLTALPSQVVAPPRVAESPVHFECVTHSFHQIGEEGKSGSATVVFGRVLRIHVHPHALSNGRADYHALRPIARLGGADYALPGGIVSVPRPVVKGPGS